MTNNFPASFDEMRRIVDANRVPSMNAIFVATVNGFNCANCNRARKDFTPIRRNDNGPFFCCFFCAFDFEGKNGDVKSAEMAAKIKAAFDRASR